MNQSGVRTFHYALRIGGSQVSCDDYPDMHNSGETALVSGIYVAEHAAINGKHAGEVVIIKGERFPCCSRCGRPLEFYLLQSAAHISEDEDFRTEADGRAA
ncbi:MAG TPA: hypothetical protein VNV88_14245 [Candidatus Solibacter sp.]|jgi:hypothetical protein|nr:hypothetical protein [Candidatus Solibacter sp.]